MIKAIFGFVNVCLSAASTFCLALIFKYVRSKAPGQQTVLDLLIMDSTRMWILFNVLTTSFITSGLVYGHFGYSTAQVMMFIFSNISSLSFASVQMTIAVKAILIFKGEWFEEVTDSTIQTSTRLATLIYSGIRFLVDYHAPSNPRHGAWNVLMA